MVHALAGVAGIALAAWCWDGPPGTVRRRTAIVFGCIVAALAAGLIADG